MKAAEVRAGSLAIALVTLPSFPKHGGAIPVVTSPTPQNSRRIARPALATRLGQVEAERTKYSKRVRQLYVRDGGICHICKGEVRIDVDRLHPKSPSQDHILARTKGGTLHTKALAHTWCNSRRGSLGLSSKKFKEIDFVAGLEAATERFESAVEI